jgi:hypothetical protein
VPLLRVFPDQGPNANVALIRGAVIEQAAGLPLVTSRGAVSGCPAARPGYRDSRTMPGRSPPRRDVLTGSMIYDPLMEHRTPMTVIHVPGDPKANLWDYCRPLLAKAISEALADDRRDQDEEAPR